METAQRPAVPARSALDAFVVPAVVDAPAVVDVREAPPAPPAPRRESRAGAEVTDQAVQLLAMAQEHAQRVRSSARDGAEAVLRRAQEQARGVLADAHARVGESERELARVRAEVSGLHAQAQALRSAREVPQRRVQALEDRASVLAAVAALAVDDAVAQASVVTTTAAAAAERRVAAARAEAGTVLAEAHQDAQALAVGAEHALAAARRDAAALHAEAEEVLAAARVAARSVVERAAADALLVAGRCAAEVREQASAELRTARAEAEAVRRAAESAAHRLSAHVHGRAKSVLSAAWAHAEGLRQAGSQELEAAHREAGAARTEARGLLEQVHHDVDRLRRRHERIVTDLRDLADAAQVLPEAGARPGLSRAARG